MNQSAENEMSGRLSILAAVFVALGAAALLTGGCEKSPAENPEQSAAAEAPQVAAVDTEETPAAREPGEESDGSAGVQQEAAPAMRVIAYYFHRTMRCDACLAIEAYTQEAILQDFSDALEDGRLEWRPVNTEEPGNEHFEDDFQLVTQSVVLAEIVNGEVIRWTKLEKVWDLLDDTLAFQEYIVEEAWEFLGG